MLIAQISDPHVQPRNILYQGVVDSNSMFAAAIETVNALSPLPDILLLTGDLVDNKTPAEYREVQRILSGLRVPFAAIPGNHDEREAFRTCFAEKQYIPKTGPIHFVIEDHGPVQIIGLDVTVPDQHHGLMDDIAAGWLCDILARNPHRPTIIMMHQPPFVTGVPYLDAYICRDGHKLSNIVSRYPAVERIVCGHVHRFMTVKFGNTLLCTAPSTTTAIALRIKPNAEPASYVEPPGILLHHWNNDAGLTTHLVHIGQFPGPYQFA